jgi:hypothetical protein
MRTDARRTIHLGVLVGVSTVGYAATLAGVTALQSASDRTVVSARAPALHAAAEIAEEHDDLGRALRAASDRYVGLADRYSDLEPRLDDLEGTLDDLGGTVERVTDSAAGLPTRLALPQLRPAPAAASAPTTHAVTGASGG